ncbi:hypothetical protein [Catenulispora sp. GAS73]|uniref:hypothetical protein n=1 Tax=Catenulispora sp. GAS73 TaxID=3156269 RepID=UPI003511B672
MNATYTKPPRAVQRISAILIRLNNLGVPLGPVHLMETGRATFPIDVIRHEGHDWLVSIFGETKWVRHARQTGQVRLRRGRRAQTFTAVEVHKPQSVALIEHMRREVRWNPWASEALRADHEHPVFRIEPQ